MWDVAASLWVLWNKHCTCKRTMCLWLSYVKCFMNITELFEDQSKMLQSEHGYWDDRFRSNRLNTLISKSYNTIEMIYCTWFFFEFPMYVYVNVIICCNWQHQNNMEEQLQLCRRDQSGKALHSTSVKDYNKQPIIKVVAAVLYHMNNCSLIRTFRRYQWLVAVAK